MNGKYKAGGIFKTNHYGNIKIIEEINKKYCLVEFLNTGNQKRVEKNNIGKGYIIDKHPRKYQAGEIFKTNNCGEIKIIEEMTKSRSLVEFINTGSKKIFFNHCINDGAIQDDSIRKYQAGGIFKTKNFGEIKIIEEIDEKKCLVEFLNTGYQKMVFKSCICRGSIKDDSNGKYKTGSIFKTINSGLVKIIESIDIKSSLVEFINTGSQKIFRNSSISHGGIKDPFKSKYKADEIFRTNNSGPVKIIEVVDIKRCLVEFTNTGSQKIVFKTALREGQIFDYTVSSNKIKIGDTFQTISGKVTVIGILKRNATESYKIIIENINKELTVIKKDLFSGSILELFEKRNTLYHYYYDHNPFHYEFFKYEFQQIEEMIKSLGDVLFLNLLKEYTNDNNITIEYLFNVIKIDGFDAFKKLYKYLIQQQSAINFTKILNIKEENKKKKKENKKNEQLISNKSARIN